MIIPHNRVGSSFEKWQLKDFVALISTTSTEKCPQLSKKDIYSYLSSESPGLRIDDFYMVYRAILNTSSSKAKPKKKRKDQLESVFSVKIKALDK